jgi:hypothetical protein
VDAAAIALASLRADASPAQHTEAPLMSDHFEQAKNDILFRTEGNGGPTPRDLLLAIEALAQDSDDQHSESMDANATLQELLARHCIEADVRDERLNVLETWRHEQVTHCEERVKKLIAEEHHSRHNAYVAGLAPSDFNSKMLWFFATTTGKLLLVAAGALVATLVNLAIYGRP